MNITKKGKVILKLILICLIVLVIFGTVYYKIDKERKQTAKGITPVIDTKEDGVLNLNGVGVFFDKYDGHLTSSKVAKKLDEITTTILPEMFKETKDLDEESLKKYYEQNTSTINLKLGISTFGKFSNFIQELKETNLELDTCYRLNVLKETFKNESDIPNYAYVEYEVVFKNEQKIRFFMYVAKTVTAVPEYMIDIK